MNTYSRKTPEDLNCGITVFMRVLGAKWKPCIVDFINRGYKRPSELHKQIPEATPRVIDMQLSELEEYGVVSKVVYEGFPLRVEYSLTEMGRSVVSIVAAMDKWGAIHAPHVQQVHARMTAAVV